MSQIEVKVLVPEDQLASFYLLVGEWLEGRGGPGGSVRAAGGRAASGPAARSGRAGGRASVKSRYAGLGDYLDEQDEDSIELSFQVVEETIGGDLPPSAARHRAWWANTETHTQARAWLDHGWEVDKVNLDQEAVTFRRV